MLHSYRLSETNTLPYGASLPYFPGDALTHNVALRTLLLPGKWSNCAVSAHPSSHRRWSTGAVSTRADQAGVWIRQWRAAGCRDRSCKSLGYGYHMLVTTHVKR